MNCIHIVCNSLILGLNHHVISSDNVATDATFHVIMKSSHSQESYNRDEEASKKVTTIDTSDLETSEEHWALARELTLKARQQVFGAVTDFQAYH